MVSYAQALGSSAQDWVAIVRIEGVGLSLSSSELSAVGSDARYAFCTEVPAYADPSVSVWQDLLLDFPDLLSERAPGGIGGGFPEMGELSFGLVDMSDLLTEQIATEGDPVTSLSSALSLTAPTINVSSSASITASSVVWIGSEACHVTAVPSATTLTVTRGYLDTDPVEHGDRSRVYVKPTYIKRRRADLYLVPAMASSRSEETLIGSYAIDSGPEWRVGDDGSGAWHFAARSQSKYLTRLAPRKARSFELVEVIANGHGANVTQRSTDLLYQWQHWTGTEATTGHSFYVRHHESKEVLSITALGHHSAVGFGRRDILGTGQGEFKPGDRFSQVFVAEDHRPECSFRFSDLSTPSTTLSGGTWTNTAHWLELMLIIMTSPSGLGASGSNPYDNYKAGYPNYASLPASEGHAFGLGMSADLIDWAGFEAVIARTVDWVFPRFVYGDRPRSFAELVSEEFLRPVGAYLTVESGTAKIVLPAMPLPGAETLTLGPADIIAREIGPGQSLPDLDITLAGYDETGAIEYRIGPAEHSLTFSAADFAETHEGGNVYRQSEPPETVPVPGGDPDLQEMYGRMAQARLYRTQRTAHEVSLAYQFEHMPETVGATCAITLDGIPNLSTAARGWTTVYGQLAEKEPAIDRDSGAHIRGKIIAYPRADRVAKVAPSAYIGANAVSSGGYELTVTAGLYCQADNGNGLATSDYLAFRAGDKVRIYNADLTLAATGWESVVQTPSANTIEITGNFSGALANDLILSGANFDDAPSSQQTQDAHMSDLGTCTPGSTGTKPFIYGGA